MRGGCSRCPSTRKICKKLGINPLRLISSGALLVTVPGDGRQLADALRKAGIPAAVIGQICPKCEGIRSERGIIHPPAPDELYKVL